MHTSWIKPLKTDRHSSNKDDSCRRKNETRDRGRRSFVTKSNRRGGTGHNSSCRHDSSAYDSVNRSIAKTHDDFVTKSVRHDAAVHSSGARSSFVQRTIDRNGFVTKSVRSSTKNHDGSTKYDGSVHGSVSRSSTATHDGSVTKSVRHATRGTKAGMARGGGGGGGERRYTTEGGASNVYVKIDDVRSLMIKMLCT